MEIPWDDDRCILCTEKHPLTIEHIIPDQLGGKLWSKILCGECNSRLGSEIEADIKKDPSIRLAIEGIKNKAPNIYLELSVGLDYIAKSKRGTVKGKFKNNEFRPRAHKAQDNSIIQPTDDAKHSIRRTLEKQNSSDETIAHTLQMIDEAPLDKLIKLNDGMKIIKWGVDEIQPDLTGPKIDDIVPLKIAYEFLAIRIRSAIYVDPFNDIRDAILNRSKNPGVYEVEHLRGPKYDPLHCIFIEQNQPYIQIMVVLFRWIIYRVKLYRLALDDQFHRVAYEVDLKTGVEKRGQI